jgi:hypothetical protein
MALSTSRTTAFPMNSDTPLTITPREEWAAYQISSKFRGK